MSKNVDSGKRKKSISASPQLYKLNLEQKAPQTMSLEKDLVHFLFARESNVQFIFSPHYSRDLQKGNYFLLYDQNRDLDVKLESEDSRMLYLAMPTEFIHDMLIEDHQHLVHLNFKGFGVKEYSEHPISPEADLVIETLMQEGFPTSLKQLYIKAKSMELLSHCYDVPEENRYENCPFLKDKDNVERIKHARNVLIEKMASPPSLPELAKIIGMNEYNLKVGFKNVYGLPAFKYLQQHRLNFAKSLLRKNQLQVNEIADEIGYTSASHFIEAFKKNFGTTPKKYQADHS